MYCSQVILLSVIAGAYCQGGHYQSPHQAAILSDTRYLAGDGAFGAAYSQEDGVVFKEESDVNGDRRGSYSYVDPTGQRRTVTYTAGKNGFQVRGMRVLAKIVSSGMLRQDWESYFIKMIRYNYHYFFLKYSLLRVTRYKL